MKAAIAQLSRMRAHTHVAAEVEAHAFSAGRFRAPGPPLPVLERSLAGMWPSAGPFSAAKAEAALCSCRRAGAAAARDSMEVHAGSAAADTL